MTITEPNGLRPGMVVTILVGREENMVLLPMTAVHRGDREGEGYVYSVVDEGDRQVAHQRRILLGGVYDNRVRIVEGERSQVRIGDAIVSAGVFRLAEGLAVRSWMSRMRTVNAQEMTRRPMTIPQFFVYKRPVAWTALVASLVWGCFAYRAMPQRHDPIIPIRIATVITIYPGADAEKVEQEVSRRIEKQLSRCGKVEKIYSLSRQNLSVVFVELFDSVKDTEEVWQDLQGRLDSMTDLPAVMGRPLKPSLNKDFGERVAMMLTISSPKVSDFEIAERAQQHSRRARSVPCQSTRGPSPGPHLGRARLSEHRRTVLRPLDGAKPSPAANNERPHRRRPDCRGAQHGLPRLSTGQGGVRETVDCRVPPLGPRHGAKRIDPSGHLAGHSRAGSRPSGDEIALLAARPDGGTGPLQLSRPAPFRRSDSRSPEAVPYHRYDRPDWIAKRGHQSPLQRPTVRALGISPHEIAQRLEARNINLPGGQVETADQKVTVHPSGEFKSEREIGEVVLDVQRGYPTYLRDMVDIVRGYEDPPGVMNLRSVKVDADDPPEAKMPGELRFGLDNGGEKAAVPRHSRLQTTRAVTLSVRQIKGSHVEQFAKDVNAAMTSLKGVLPEDLRIEWTHDEPEDVREKIRQFDQNLIEAVVIVVIVALLFMEWRSALLGGDFHPLDGRHDARLLSTAGDRSAAGFDRGHDHRIGIVGG